MNIQPKFLSQVFVANQLGGIKLPANNNNTLERVPSKDSVSFSGAVNNSAEDKVKDLLDNTAFEFKKANGDVFKGTIKEYFEDSIINHNSTKNLSLVHCTTSKEAANSIIENGLDWQKTGRMKCGPGTYFAMSTFGGSEQGAGSIPIEGTYIGDKDEYPVFSKNFYEAVTYNQDLQNAVAEIVPDNTNKAVNKYCHDLLQDDMGIDLLYASSGYGTGAYAVINNDCMKLSPLY